MATGDGRRECDRQIGRCLSGPGIHKLRAEVLEVTGVTGGKGCPQGRSDASDLHAAYLDRAAGSLPGHGNARCSEGGRLVERLDASIEVLAE